MLALPHEVIRGSVHYTATRNHPLKATPRRKEFSSYLRVFDFWIKNIFDFLQIF